MAQQSIEAVDPSVAALAAVTASEPTSSTQGLHPTSIRAETLRELKRGDLVRVVDGKQSGGRGLGRIISVSTPQPDSPVRFNVEFVLGGRLSSVERNQLIYTTADAEGLTQESRGQRRTAKKPAEESLEPKSAAVPPKKKAKKRKKAATTKPKKVKATTKTKKKQTTKKTTASAKRGKSKKNAPPQPPPTTEASTTIPTKSIYQRHLREFEKILTRLEKIDRFGFFLSLSSADDLGVSMEESPGVDTTPMVNWKTIRERMQKDRYVLDLQEQEQQESSKASSVTLQHPKAVHWDLFRNDVIDMCNAAIRRDPMGDTGGSGTLGYAARKIKDATEQAYERTGRRHLNEINLANARQKYSAALHASENNEAAFQGEWRRDPFAERKYERLYDQNVICAGLSELDQRSAIYELQTSIPDSFVGLSYKFDDVGQSEGWMKSVVDNTARKRKRKDEIEERERAAAALAADNGVVRAQVQASMQTMLIAVHDRVMTDKGVLNDAELRSANWEKARDAETKSGEGIPNSSIVSSELDNVDENPSGCELVEQPVWGLDCYTRRNITMCLESEFSPEVAYEFVEKWLLPAINACPVEIAHNISYATRILEGLPLEEGSINDVDDNSTASYRGEFKGQWSNSLLGKALLDKIETSGPKWLKSAARELRLAYEAMGADFFRAHPKGHGSLVLRHDGIPANTLVTFYRGEVYPPWRWSEKMDAIEMTQTALGRTPVLPDFYNMVLERPQVDPRGYGMLFVDASRKAGHGSSLSHSCEPTCEVRVSAVNGQLCLAMTTLREVEQGEELTFDYNAVTESLNEYRAAVCLCGYRKCRGSFLHFATADCYQQVLSRNCPIAVRFANLIKGCMKMVMSGEDEKVLSRHGFGTAAFGAVGFNRHTQGKDPLDSMEYVPVWLRTYVADTLRYIEYERRALPIALLCDHLSTTGAEQSPRQAKKRMKTSLEPKLDCEATSISSVAGNESSKRIQGSKPMPVFLFFAGKQQGYFLKLLREQGGADLKGAALKRALQKVAASSWKALGEDRKQYWKDRAVEEWERSGGKEKAKLEEERSKCHQSADTSESTNSNADSTIESVPEQSNPSRKGSEASKDSGKVKKKGSRSKRKDFVCPSKISFEAADAEGVAAMEQRVQQLTQTLSRVGRVLDRHRESTFGNSESSCPNVVSPALLRGRIHSPISIMSDLEVVGWIWNHHDGVVQSLSRIIDTEKCVSPSLRKSLHDTADKYKTLRAIENPAEKPTAIAPCTMSGAEARKALKAALLEFREVLLKGLADMEADRKRHARAMARKRAHARRERLKKLKQEASEAGPDVGTNMQNRPEGPLPIAGSNVDALASSVSINNVVDSVVANKEETTTGTAIQADHSARGDVESQQASSIVSQVLHGIVETIVSTHSSEQRSKIVDNRSKPEPEVPKLGKWMKHYSERGVLFAAADLLLIYAHTSTFFVVKPYLAFESTPIEVYARELGSAIPKSVMDAAKVVSDCAPDGDGVSGGDGNEETPLCHENGPGDPAPRGSNTHSSSVDDRQRFTDSPNGTDTDTDSPEIQNADISSRSADLPDEMDNGNGDSSKTCNSLIDKSEFVAGARFDVLRKGKDKPCPGVVTETEFTPQVERIKFHFPRMKTKFDEWVELGSNRISRIAKNPLKRKEINAKRGPVAETTKAENSSYCEPDDIITNVVVKYHGDYVLSQLLQWYNGGIGQKPGMPDLMGCALLPPLSSCVSHFERKDEKSETVPKKKSSEQTYYETEVRRLLKEWFEDASKRGNPWPDELRRAFCTPHCQHSPTTACNDFMPFGSPVFDLLVTGDDANLNQIVLALTEQLTTGESDEVPGVGGKRRAKSATEKLQSSVDYGRPAQAVANWVQCENPHCLKWRKLPWFVDVDVLPEAFFCKDNIWNPDACSCEAPEDAWDENEDPQLGSSPQKSGTGQKRKRIQSCPPNKKAKSGEKRDGAPLCPPGNNKIDKRSFVRGARFTVSRYGYRDKVVRSEAVVIETASEGGVLKVKFHFLRRQAKFDEWLRADSNRISPLENIKDDGLVRESRASTEISKDSGENEKANQPPATKLAAVERRSFVEKSSNSDRPMSISSEDPVASVPHGSFSANAAEHSNSFVPPPLAAPVLPQKNIQGVVSPTTTSGTALPRECMQPSLTPPVIPQISNQAGMARSNKSASDQANACIPPSFAPPTFPQNNHQGVLDTHTRQNAAATGTGNREVLPSGNPHAYPPPGPQGFGGLTPWQPEVASGNFNREILFKLNPQALTSTVGMPMPTNSLQPVPSFRHEMSCDGSIAGNGNAASMIPYQYGNSVGTIPHANISSLSAEKRRFH